MFITAGVRMINFNSIDEIEDRSLEPDADLRANTVFVYLRSRVANEEIVFADEEADEFRKQFNAMCKEAGVANPVLGEAIKVGDRVVNREGAEGEVVAVNGAMVKVRRGELWDINWCPLDDLKPAILVDAKGQRNVLPLKVGEGIEIEDVGKVEVLEVRGEFVRLRVTEGIAEISCLNGWRPIEDVLDLLKDAERTDIPEPAPTSFKPGDPVIDRAGKRGTVTAILHDCDGKPYGARINFGVGHHDGRLFEDLRHADQSSPNPSDLDDIA